MKCDCDEFVSPNSSVSSVCLRDLRVFHGVGDSDFKRFGSIGVRKVFCPGEALFVQGDPVHEVFAVKSGRIRLSKVLEDGTEITLDYRKAGDLVGEEAFSHSVNYPLTAWAMEETMTCGFRVRDFNRLILDNPDLGLKLIGNMSSRIQSLNARLETASAGNLEDRVFRILSTIASEHGRKTSKGYSIAFPLTHEELSYLVGAHRVSVTRALKRLREVGKVVKEDNRFIVPVLVAQE
ncbi:MAG: Crp/Fnr family transcriptional regulator [Desulfomonilaceae bacterium]|nr:Crp/Fnr family transcriptional regulator [Desulfomonilaceae bacterium]